MLDGNDLWDLVERRADASPKALLATDEHGADLHFGELRERALALAGAFARRGVSAETRIAWSMPTRLEALVLTAALSRLDAVQIPLMASYGTRELAFIIGQAAPARIVVPRSWKQTQPLALVEAALQGEGDPPPIDVLEDLLPGDARGSLPPAPALSPHPHDAPTRWIFYTSGTTSVPKGALHSDATLAASARGLDAPHRFVPEDRVSLVFPYPHIGGPSLLISALRVGYALILTETFEVARVCETLARAGVTLAGPGPAFWQAFIAAQRECPARRLFPQLRALIGGGAAKPANLQREAREVLGVDIVSGYGLTECPALAYNQLGDSDEVLATDGRAVLGAELQVVGPQGTPLPPGQAGEIRVRGAMRFQGYLDPELDAEVIDAEGYVRTGDLGVLDAQGQLRVTGRKKDVIIRKGENISAKEVEDVLVLHARVREVAVVGLPDRERGERCCAVVVPVAAGDRLSVEDLATHCLAAGLMRIKIPEQVENVTCLPVNATGKVLKAALRDRFRGIYGS